MMHGMVPMEGHAVHEQIDVAKCAEQAYQHMCGCMHVRQALLLRCWLLQLQPEAEGLCGPAKRADADAAPLLAHCPGLLPLPLPSCRRRGGCRCAQGAACLVFKPQYLQLATAMDPALELYGLGTAATHTQCAHRHAMPCGRMHAPAWVRG